MTSHANTGDCWICGTSTTARCGPCAQAGVEIFFCSREHQKLVWSAHKRVCGSAAPDFVSPAFNDEEAQLLLDLLPQKRAGAADDELPEGEALIVQALRTMRLPEDQLLEVGVASLRDPSAMHAHIREVVLNGLRMSLHHVVSERTGITTATWSTLNPFLHLASLRTKIAHTYPFLGQDLFSGLLATRYIVPSPMASRRILTFFALRQYTFAEHPPTAHEHGHTRYALQKLYDELVVGKMAPNLDVLNKMRLEFCQTLGCDKFSEGVVCGIDCVGDSAARITSVNVLP